MTPQCSIRFTTDAAEDPGTWQPLFDRVRAADRPVVNRVGLNGEQVVFGGTVATTTDRSSADGPVASNRPAPTALSRG